MAFSMTGFGRANGKFGEIQVNIEIRTVNHRFQEISIRLPKNYSTYENIARDIVRKDVKRGKISVFINIDEGSSKLESVTLNKPIAKGYYNLLNELKDVTGISEPVSLTHLMRFEDIFQSDDNDKEDEAFTNFFKRLTLDCVSHLNEMRKEEGDALVKDMLERNSFISNATQFFEEESKDLPKIEFNKMYERIKDNMNLGEIDRDRLEQEIAIISDRVDISEEVVRLKSHCDLFEKEMKKNDSIGKRINFIIQEMNREVNTIGSKSSKVEILHKVVDVKQEIEKMREQIQNVE